MSYFLYGVCKNVLCFGKFKASAVGDTDALGVVAKVSKGRLLGCITKYKKVNKAVLTWVIGLYYTKP